MLMGRVRARFCEPHLHDTFTIAYLRRGRVSVVARGRSWMWQEGEIFLGNPFEVHEGGNDERSFEYDVYYPSIELMTECAAVGGTRQPRFVEAILKDRAL